MKISLNYDISRLSWCIWAYSDDHKYQYKIDVSITKEETTEGLMSEPSLQLSRKAVDEHRLFEAIKEAMVNAGLMADSRASVSELKATKYHLEDMRKFFGVHIKSLESIR